MYTNLDNFPVGQIHTDPPGKNKRLVILIDDEERHLEESERHTRGALEILAASDPSYSLAEDRVRIVKIQDPRKALEEIEAVMKRGNAWSWDEVAKALGLFDFCLGVKGWNLPHTVKGLFEFIRSKSSRLLYVVRSAEPVERLSREFSLKRGKPVTTTRTDIEYKAGDGIKAALSLRALIGNKNKFHGLEEPGLGTATNTGLAAIILHPKPYFWNSNAKFLQDAGLKKGQSVGILKGASKTAAIKNIDDLHSKNLAIVLEWLDTLVPSELNGTALEPNEKPLGLEASRALLEKLLKLKPPSHQNKQRTHDEINARIAADPKYFKGLLSLLGEDNVFSNSCLEKLLGLYYAIEKHKKEYCKFENYRDLGQLLYITTSYYLERFRYDR